MQCPEAWVVGGDDEVVAVLGIAQLRLRSGSLSGASLPKIELPTATLPSPVGRSFLVETIGTAL